MGNQLATQASVAVLVSYALQWIKQSKWFPFITTETQTLNRWISAVVAFASGLGIFFTWNHTAGTLTIAGLTAANLLHAGTGMIQQWLFQHAAYRTLVAPPLPGAVQAQEKDAAAAVAVVQQAQMAGVQANIAIGSKGNPIG
jgi:hypothetical protein